MFTWLLGAPGDLALHGNFPPLPRPMNVNKICISFIASCYLIECQLPVVKKVMTSGHHIPPSLQNAKKQK